MNVVTHEGASTSKQYPPILTIANHKSRITMSSQLYYPGVSTCSD
jgi:hypothetical protein